jgi:hypothetical protein
MRTIFTLLLFVGALSLAQAQELDKQDRFDHTFAHVVHFWFKNPDSQADRATFEASLTKFLNSSQYAKTKFIGKPPKAVRGVVDDSFTYSLILTFDSPEAQQAYQDEPAHLVFVRECESLWEKVLVHDSEGI